MGGVENEQWPLGVACYLHTCHFLRSLGRIAFTSGEIRQSQFHATIRAASQARVQVKEYEWLVLAQLWRGDAVAVQAITNGVENCYYMDSAVPLCYCRMKKFALGCGGLVAVVLLLAIVVGIGGCSSYNRVVTLSQDTDAKWAQVQNQYQRRFDLIPNLVSTVSGAANFEKSTLTEITAARASVGQVKLDPNQAPTDAAKLQEFERAQGQLSSALSRLLVVSERYPDLRANSNFRDLQAELSGTENRIAVERMRFNESVQAYNTAIRKQPTAILAGMFNFHPKPYFQSTTGAETPPKVNFDFGKPATAPPVKP